MEQGVADYIASRYDGLVVEIGVGDRTEVAERLAAEPHLDVLATDRERRSLDGPRFARDDVTDPDTALYRDASLLYALRPPPELHRPIAELADAVGADGLIVPLATDPVTVEHELVDHDGVGIRVLATGGA